jgi:hypothetical protein
MKNVTNTTNFKICFVKGADLFMIHKPKNKTFVFALLAMILLIMLAGGVAFFLRRAQAAGAQSAGQIYLYGEAHGSEKILNEEFELWQTYYTECGMRHLFVELPYYTAEYLNLWMQAEDDAILDQFFEDIQGTAGCTEYNKAFYQRIKEACPETVFHGTDVGHTFWSTGRRYIEALEAADQKDTEAYSRASENIMQGALYYFNSEADGQDHAYRETKMIENFIREFDALPEGTSIMGIYGNAHTDLEGIAAGTTDLPCMANQLKEKYGDALHTVDLTLLSDPLRVDTIEINGKEYTASYFGEVDISNAFPAYRSRAFWRLEDAYEDFKDCPTGDDWLPYRNYPMAIEQGQVFVIEYTLADGTTERSYYRSDGKTWNGYSCTQVFFPQ